MIFLSTSEVAPKAVDALDLCLLTSRDRGNLNYHMMRCLAIIYSMYLLLSVICIVYCPYMVYWSCDMCSTVITPSDVSSSGNSQGRGGGKCCTAMKRV